MRTSLTLAFCGNNPIMLENHCIRLTLGCALAKGQHKCLGVQHAHGEYTHGPTTERHARQMAITSKFALGTTLLIKYAPCRFASLKLHLRQFAEVKFDRLKSCMASHDRSPHILHDLTPAL